MAKKISRLLVGLKCAEEGCGRINYIISFNKIKLNEPDTIKEYKKFCSNPSCRSHTVHRITKKID